MLVGGCATTPTMKSVVGTYSRSGWLPATYTFLENGEVENYDDGLTYHHIWKIVDEEIQVKLQTMWLVFRINKDKSITLIAAIRNGRRNSLPKKRQGTYKKIK